MSSNYLTDFSRFVNENYIRYEAELTLNEMLGAIEVTDYDSKLVRLQAQLDQALQKNSKLNSEVEVLTKNKDSLMQQQSEIKAKALTVRNIFVSDIGAVLNEGRSVVKLKSKIRSLEDKVGHIAQLETDLDDTQQKFKTIEKAYYLTQSAKESGESGSSDLSLTTVEDSLLLNVFSFLQTEDVLSAAQVNRMLFARVDNLFSIGSELIQADWIMGSLGDADGDDAVAMGVAADNLLSKEMVEQLAKKLTAPELKAIVAMKEHINKQEEKIVKLNTQSEDNTEKIENTERVRDFLIEKLKTAEMAIKKFIKDNSELKVQASADREVISFLDLHRLEIDSVNRDLLSKNEAHRASVDVLTSINAQTEKQYGMEVAELKDRLSMAEKEHKSQKKLLAKEIKTLRGLLSTNTEELERHRSHLNHLRKSLDIVGLSSVANGGDHGSIAGSAHVPTAQHSVPTRNHSHGGSQRSHRAPHEATNPFA